MSSVLILEPRPYEPKARAFVLDSLCRAAVYAQTWEAVLTCAEVIANALRIAKAIKAGAFRADLSILAAEQRKQSLDKLRDQGVRFENSRMEVAMKDRQDQLYKNWSDWLTNLDHDVLSLHSHGEVFWRVQEIIRNNPKVGGQGNHFLYYMKGWYEAFVGAAIRRLADRTGNTRSYLKLLVEIKNDNEVISRARFKQNFVDSSYTEERADKALDSLIGKGEAYIRKSDVSADIHKLDSNATAIREFVNDHIAHTRPYRTQTTALPNHSDVKTAMDAISEIHLKYWQIFKGSSLMTTTPKIQYDWEDIFRIPWIDTTS